MIHGHGPACPPGRWPSGGNGMAGADRDHRHGAGFSRDRGGLLLTDAVLLVGRPARPGEAMARRGAGMDAVAQDVGAVDPDVADAG